LTALQKIPFDYLPITQITKKVNCGNASKAFQLTKTVNKCHLKIQDFTKSMYLKMIKM